MAHKPLVKIADQLIHQSLVSINKPGAPQWQLITRSNSQLLSVHYQLSTFKSTWTFLNSIAQQAAKARHHPTIITTYNKIDLEITTHDVGNHITELDLDLAKSIHEEYIKQANK
ncbi:uncharacterized protein SPAPADRAFT_137617 [Spathaspora passalidarum NRRL Y-27907]|uniref:4a-hydroxytetrahydrobiopterin dehydratase n=1 Tax=Spathaspora passalidarum (strain NRRL Y-27907 / 11-Y1) TaxID=619300 RepID=G3AKJ8_SPAPN|nr:uncharacterized protein SPAPADRAFT_137617 [Spathaspora passalidarum NRRL Y-27907]EGW33604.1 hypothetical protein SPAPADRAFT_137617 [Spathaspora passalidarum NRRL Y-27907]